MKILLLFGFLFYFTPASVLSFQPGTICSHFIRLKNNVLVQVCRQCKLHYLSFRFGNDPGQKQVTDIRFELNASDMQALSGDRVRTISIVFQSKQYAFELNAGDGSRLERLCAAIR